MIARTPSSPLVAAWRNALFRHCVYWLSAFAFFYLSVLIYDDSALALKIAAVVLLPAPAPVYLHLAAWKFCFARRRYVLYFAALVAILGVSAWWIEFVFQLIMQDPASHISGFAVALFFIVFTTGFKYFTQGSRQQYLLQEAEFKQMQTELALLKSQLHPHFFFNTLNNLYALSLERSDRVPEVILKLSELMRYVLDSSRRKTVALADELRFIENYVELERLRLSGGRDISLRIEGHPNGAQIAPMLLIPFVENGFKHGMDAAAGEGFIAIRARLGRGRFRFTVSNSKHGPGGSAPACSVSGGIGLENARRRLQLHYPGAHELFIRDTDESYEVELSIEL
jgi:hypothetical protein